MASLWHRAEAEEAHAQPTRPRHNTQRAQTQFVIVPPPHRKLPHPIATSCPDLRAPNLTLSTPRPFLSPQNCTTYDRHIRNNKKPFYLLITCRATASIPLQTRPPLSASSPRATTASHPRMRQASSPPYHARPIRGRNSAVPEAIAAMYKAVDSTSF